MKDYIWHVLRRHHIQAILAMLSDSGKATSINTYLSTLKGFALEAWTMKQLDTDSY